LGAIGSTDNLSITDQTVVEGPFYGHTVPAERMYGEVKNVRPMFTKSKRSGPIDDRRVLGHRLFDANVKRARGASKGDWKPSEVDKYIDG